MILPVSLLFGCVWGTGAAPPPPAQIPAKPRATATFRIPDAALPKPLVIVAYGDMRCTDPGETTASNPAARRALVAKVAAEEPAALFISGDVPWHGVAGDYAVFGEETARWRAQNLRVYPALGNHEFSRCEVPACLNLWWHAFPELTGLRWYSVALGGRVLALALDSNASLLPASEQRLWLEDQLTALDDGVRLVVVILHHPPVADVQTRLNVDHNPRANEQALVGLLERVSKLSKARFIVTAGHVHNYERLEQSGVVYLVSGGGGAHPSEVERTPEDLYQSPEFPNFHYVRFEVASRSVLGEMIRLGDSGAAVPGKWQVRDRFELTLPP